MWVNAVLPSKRAHAPVLPRESARPDKLAKFSFKVRRKSLGEGKKDLVSAEIEENRAWGLWVWVDEVDADAVVAASGEDTFSGMAVSEDESNEFPDIKGEINLDRPSTGRPIFEGNGGQCLKGIEGMGV